MKELELLKKLENIISDVGVWTWWATNLPNSIQIEFNGTQLYFPAESADKPPSSKLAVQFGGPKSINFLSRFAKTSENPSDWYDLLHEDKFKCPTCSYEYFTFTDKGQMKKIIQEAKEIKT